MRYYQSGAFANCLDANIEEEGIFLKIKRYLNRTNNLTQTIASPEWVDSRDAMRETLADIKVGERFIMLKRMVNAQFYYDGGGQNSESTETRENLFTTKCEVDFRRYGDGYLPSEDEIVSAYEEAIELITMLKLAGYKVAYFNERGEWRERWPKIGDTVTLPRDVVIDLNSESPIEDRPDSTATQHTYDDRYYSNHKAGNLGYVADTTFVKLTLGSFYHRIPAGLPDAMGISRLRLAYRKMLGYADDNGIQCASKLTRKYRLQHIKYKVRALSLAQWLDRGAKLREKWEFNWILDNIYVIREVQEKELIDDYYWDFQSKSYQLR